MTHTIKTDFLLTAIHTGTLTCANDVRRLYAEPETVLAAISRLVADGTVLEEGGRYRLSEFSATQNGPDQKR